MYKKLKTVLLLMIGVFWYGALNAQVTKAIEDPVNLSVKVVRYDAIFSWDSFIDSFEDGTFDAWAEVIEGAGTPGASSSSPPYWQVREGNSLPEGTHEAVCGWGYNIDTWMITPTISVNSATKLTFWWNKSYYWSVTNNNDDLLVKVSTDDGATWTSIWREEDHGQFTSFTWIETTLDLSAYAGQNCKIAFNVVGNDNQENCIDNVSIGDSERTIGSRVISDAAKVAADAKTDGGYKYTFINKADVRDITGYNVFLNGEQKATNISKRTFTFEDLAIGDHTAGVQRVYSSGVSEIVTKDFTIVKVIDVTSVSLSESTVTIKIDSTFQITATVDPDTATNKNITWTSTADSVATVDATGLVKGISAGIASIVVTTEDGNFTDTCVVTVEENSVAVTGVSLSKSEVVIKTDSIVQLTATVEPDEAINKNVTWTTSNGAVATVADGLVNGVSEGTAQIVVMTEDGNFTDTCVVTVVENYVSATSVTISESVVNIKTDSTFQLSATVAPNEATNKNVIWTSSADSVATVDANGLVTGVSAGTTAIVVTTDDGNFTDTCVVTVEAGEVFDEPINLYVEVDGYDAIFTWDTEAVAGFSDSFEDGTLDAWAEVIEGDGTSGATSSYEAHWQVNSEVGVPDGGHQAICGWGYDIDTWMITPTISVNSTTKLTFWWNKSYYWSVTNNNDDLLVKVSTDDGATWTSIWREEDHGQFTSFTWIETTLDLSAYAGQNCKIAFNVVGDDNQQNCIDNVRIGDSNRSIGSRVISDAAKVAADAKTDGGYKYTFINKADVGDIIGYNVFLNGEQKATNISEKTLHF